MTCFFSLFSPDKNDDGDDDDNCCCCYSKMAPVGRFSSGWKFGFGETYEYSWAFGAIWSEIATHTRSLMVFTAKCCFVLFFLLGKESKIQLIVNFLPFSQARIPSLSLPHKFSMRLRFLLRQLLLYFRVAGGILFAFRILYGIPFILRIGVHQGDSRYSHIFKHLCVTH